MTGARDATTLIVFAEEPVPGRVTTRPAPARTHGPALLIGEDTPRVTAPLPVPALRAAAWRDCDAWFCPAVDGAFRAPVLADPDPELLRAMDMSMKSTGARQRPRLIDAHLTVRDLPTLRDVDTADDGPALAAVAPNGRCAAAFRRMTKAATR
ncbi:hypothetical protein [Streptomyces sp. NPDC101393]|uniref:hypothetical protein n=1 Tax=Streptomyces sp. NPDC101393 TaxID=3366141 RepID=UPI00382AF946